MADVGTDHNADDWRAAGGNIQTVTFYITLCNALAKTEPFQSWSTWVQDKAGEIFVHKLTIHDYGCAHGDGTAVLKATFPMAKVTGIDISEQAIGEAVNRWPTLDFQVGDIRKPQGEADITIASHVIEHMADPVSVIEGLRRRCHVLVVVLPTILEGHDGGHTGAVETKVVIEQIGEHVGKYATAGYLTLREDVEHVGHGVVESNNVLVIKGEL